MLYEIGIEIPPFYLLNGKIKEKPEDFIVEEAWKGKRLKVKYSLLEKILDFIKFNIFRKKYVHFTLVKRNISTFDVIEIMRKKGIRRVYYAGLKDKFAVTAQRMCVEAKYEKILRKIKSKSFFIKNIEYLDFRVRRGSNDGNYFIIKIKKKTSERDSEILEEFSKREIPNFFGVQRFGIKRPNNHKIGYLIIKKEYEMAIFEILRPYYERGVELEVREYFLENFGKWKEIYEKFKLVKELWVERILLKKLAQGKTYEEAIMSLPKDILRLWVDAYQSYLFNKTLSRIFGKINLERIPLISWNLNLDKWAEIKDVVLEILEEEGITLSEFKIRKKIRPKVVLRNTKMRVKDFKYKVLEDGIVIEFFLSRGEYATNLLYFLGIF